MEGHRSKASEPFHTEILELLAEMQRNDPAVRAALAEVGGLEELLGIIEAAAEIKPTETDRSKQLVAVEVRPLAELILTFSKATPGGMSARAERHAV